MQIRSTDKSVLMEVARVAPEQGRIVITGKIMGALPMKAVVEPRDLRALLWSMGLRSLMRTAWLVLFPGRR